jgi:hypothetical protein
MTSPPTYWRQLANEARLAAKEAVSVERLAKTQMGVVEMMTELVHERTQEGAKADYPAVRGSTHPETDFWHSLFFVGVQAM